MSESKRERVVRQRGALVLTITTSGDPEYPVRAIIRDGNDLLEMFDARGSVAHSMTYGAFRKLARSR